MIDLNGLAKRLAVFRQKNKLPRGNYEYTFLRAVCEIAEAYESHVKGEKKIGEEIADVMIFLLDVVDQKNLNIERDLMNKVKKIEKRKYKKQNGYVGKVRRR